MRKPRCSCAESSDRSSATWKPPRKNESRTTHRCHEGRDGRTPFEILHGKRPHQEFVPFGERVLARPTSTDPLNRMNPRYRFSMWLRVKNNSADCFVNMRGLAKFDDWESVGKTTHPMNRMNPRYRCGIWLALGRNISAECFTGAFQGVLRAHEVRRLEQKDRWDTGMTNMMIGMPWRLADGQTGSQSRSGATPPMPLVCDCMTLRPTVTRWGVWGATQVGILTLKLSSLARPVNTKKQ